MSLSVVSTSELADSIADSSSADGEDLKSSDDALTVLEGDDSNQADALESNAADDQAQASSDGSDSTLNAADDSSNDSDDSGEFPDCNLTMNKTGDRKVQAGEIVTWKITVRNSLNIAWNVVVKEKLPKNFEIVSVKASKGTFNNETHYWEIVKLNKNESATLTIKAKAKKAGNFTNAAEILTDSNNLNKNTGVKADIEVSPKETKKASVNKSNKANKNKVKESKDKGKIIKNQTKDGNETIKVDLEHAGNPVMVILISIFTVFGLGILRKQ